MKNVLLSFICLMQASFALVVSGTSGISVVGDTEIVSNDGTTIVFQSIHDDGSNQGAEITHDTSASFVPSSSQPLYFQFSSIVAPVSTDFFYGNAGNPNKQSSDSNAFSIVIESNGHVIAREKGQANVTLLTGLSLNDVVDFDIIVYSDGAHKFTYDITATSGAVSYTETGIEGNQNADSDPSNYDFFAVGTGQGQPREQFELSNFAVGDEPITNVPEPTSGLLLLGSSLALLLRRRR